MFGISATDGAALASSVFAAAAAGASWVTVVVDRKRQADLRRPIITALFGVSTGRMGRIVFANGGSGMAGRVGFFGVDTNRNAIYQSSVGNGLLPPGAQHSVPVGQVENRRGSAQFVWFATDVDHNFHIWTYDGRYDQIGSRDYLEGRAPQTFQEIFQRMYPDVDVPGDGD